MDPCMTSAEYEAEERRTRAMNEPKTQYEPQHAAHTARIASSLEIIAAHLGIISANLERIARGAWPWDFYFHPAHGIVRFCRACGVSYVHHTGAMICYSAAPCDHCASPAVPPAPPRRQPETLEQAEARRQEIHNAMINNQRPVRLSVGPPVPPADAT